MKFDRVPIKLTVRARDNLRDAYGGVSGGLVLDGEHLRPSAPASPHTVCVFMHPVCAADTLHVFAV